jgi:hypothetical protein
MYVVGYIDDDSSTFTDYKKRLARKNIELKFVDGCISLDEVLKWIIANSVECLLVDHKLTAKYTFNGTNVVAFINSQIPDLQCIILTNYTKDSEEDNLVAKNLIVDRQVMAQSDITSFAETIKQSAKVFRNRMKIHLDDYESLLNKKQKSNISAIEEEKLLFIYKLLVAYGEVDEVATELLKPDVDKKIDNLMETLDRYIDSKKK